MAKKEAPADDAAEGGKKGKKKLIIIILAVILLLGAGGGGYAYMTGMFDKDAADQPTTEPTIPPPPADKTVNIDSITINLAQNSGFLKMSISVQFGPNFDQTQFSTSAINDEVIKLYGRLTIQDLSDPAFKEVTKQQLRDQLNELYGKDAVQAVYYTEFVTQPA